MSRQVVIVGNSNAPRAGAANWTDLCARGLGPGFEISEKRVTSYDAAREAAAQAAQAGAWLIVSVGGDGTAMAVLNGIGAHPTRLAVLPAGTANELASQMGLGNDPIASAAALATCECVEFDCMRVNGVRFAVGATGGWLSYGMDRFNRLRGRGPRWRRVFGPWGRRLYIGYMLWGLRQLDELSSPVRVRYRHLRDGAEQTLELEAAALAVAGPPAIKDGELQIFPGADMADGKLEVLLLRKAAPARILKVLKNMGSGAHLAMPEVLSLQSDRIDLEFARPILFLADGEPVPGGPTYHIDLAPEPIRLLAPRRLRPGSRLLSRT